MYSGTLIGVLGWVCIGISLCIGQLGRKNVYVCFKNGMKKQWYEILMSNNFIVYLEDVTKSFIGLFSEVIIFIVAR